VGTSGPSEFSEHLGFLGKHRLGATGALPHPGGLVASSLGSGLVDSGTPLRVPGALSRRLLWAHTTLRLSRHRTFLRRLLCPFGGHLFLGPIYSRELNSMGAPPRACGTLIYRGLFHRVSLRPHHQVCFSHRAQLVGVIPNRGRGILSLLGGPSGRIRPHLLGFYPPVLAPPSRLSVVG